MLSESVHVARSMWKVLLECLQKGFIVWFLFQLSTYLEVLMGSSN